MNFKQLVLAAAAVLAAVLLWWEWQQGVLGVRVSAGGQGGEKNAYSLPPKFRLTGAFAASERWRNVMSSSFPPPLL